MYSPAINLSRVVLPAPLGATRPVRPSPTVKDRSANRGVPSGQANNRFEPMMEDMREISRGLRAHRLPQERKDDRGLDLSGSPGDVVVSQHVSAHLGRNSVRLPIGTPSSG